MQFLYPNQRRVCPGCRASDQRTEGQEGAPKRAWQLTMLWPSPLRPAAARAVAEADRMRTALLGGLPRPFAPAAGQGAVELAAGAYVELGEDLVQVVLDGAGAHEQLGGDLGVGQAVAGQPGDLGLPGGELGGGIGGALADALAGGQQLAFAAPGEPLGAHRGPRLVRGAQLLAGVRAAVLAAQPLPVQEA